MKFRDLWEERKIIVDSLLRVFVEYALLLLVYLLPMPLYFKIMITLFVVIIKQYFSLIISAGVEGQRVAYNAERCFHETHMTTASYLSQQMAEPKSPPFDIQSLVSTSTNNVLNDAQNVHLEDSLSGGPLYAYSLILFFKLFTALFYVSPYFIANYINSNNPALLSKLLSYQ